MRSFYEGKKIAYVYRGQKEIRGTKIRVIWGKVTRPHGMLAKNCFWYTTHQSTDTFDNRQLWRRPRQVHFSPSY